MVGVGVSVYGRSVSGIGRGVNGCERRGRAVESKESRPVHG